MMSPEQALQGALEKLPTGFVWPRDPDSRWGRLLDPASVEQSSFEAAAERLRLEATPSSAEALLDDYERVLGPDPCRASSNPSFDERRASVHARWVGVGGASRQDYIDLAARYGFAISIAEFTPARYGQRRYGLPMYGTAWAYAWQVTVAATTFRVATYGTHRSGEPYRSWGSPVLECVLRRAAPAHLCLLFAYTGTAPTAGWDAGGWNRDAWAA